MYRVEHHNFIRTIKMYLDEDKLYDTSIFYFDEKR